MLRVNTPYECFYVTHRFKFTIANTIACLVLISHIHQYIVSLQDTTSPKIPIIAKAMNYLMHVYTNLQGVQIPSDLTKCFYNIAKDNSNRFWQFRNKKIGCLIRFRLNEISTFTSNSIKSKYIYFDQISYFADCHYNFHIILWPKAIRYGMRYVIHHAVRLLSIIGAALTGSSMWCPQIIQSIH